jgi:hypothetical protein
MNVTTAPSLSAPRAVTPDQLEQYSSAVTLSDMEIFVFPELLYSLVLANIMSPRLWAWRSDPWFEKVESMTPYRRVLRLKQFIIDHYEFNLDLDTWGLTTQAKELARFRPFLDEQTLRASNALFGYEGDKYYFSIDIRRHFGLDKYTTEVIPYWKTETLEAMDAFRFKEGYSSGAGECVSLSALYAAALFVVCRIPLDDIFLMGTPLHSQNFVVVSDGVLTNNRRVVTRNMWFNGTEQTAKAQRALRHEQVTVVAHHTGHVHCVYPRATIEPAAYQRFKKQLQAFLRTKVTMEILANFLRDNSDLQKCFQIQYALHGRTRYIAAEKVYAYEHNSNFKVSDSTRARLLAELDEDEFFPDPLPDRLVLNNLEHTFKQGDVDLARPDDRQRLAAALDCQCGRAGTVLERLAHFVHLEPRLPDSGHTVDFAPGPALPLTPDLDRAEIIARLESLRDDIPTADLAFYAYRDLSRTDWAPFLKAAVERNPVSVKALEGAPDDEVIRRLAALPGESIYDGPRLAQPDEVWNYQRGDGLEKAIALANILMARQPGLRVAITSSAGEVRVEAGGRRLAWPTAKGLDAAFEL